jgi:amino acid adenylation domain-containing protein
VLKTGSAFVPLDPSLPSHRLETIARDASPVLILSTAPALAPEGYPVADPDDAGEDLVARDTAGTPDDLAYVLYTSGTTGTPKGVMIPHRGIANRVLWQAAELGLSADDAVVHKTPISFDVSIGEIFLPLVAGARLVVAEPAAHKDPRRLLDLIARERVTFVHFVPSMLDVVLDEDDITTSLGAVRHIWCGGEALSPRLYARYQERHGKATLYNGYGPTEASIGVTWRAYRPGDHPSRITIGRPIANTRIHILDGHRQPVPIGAAGEIYIGGPQLALGYLNDPGLTSGRFVPDPFSPPGALLYRTGDHARYLRDGTIEFLGRADSQVKLRGVRIELEEIEATLCGHTAVRRCAVRWRQEPDVQDGGHLDAYVVLAPQVAPSVPTELRDWLGARLPGYMIPETITVIRELPLTSSGKIDRGALSAPAASRPEPAAPARPHDRLQREILACWKQVLHRDDIGVRDNFFDVGGHSLLLVKGQQVLRARLGADISLVDLFTYPTVESLAAHIGVGGGGDLDGARSRATRQREALLRQGAAPTRKGRQGNS